jgi:exonuclease VII small subunit
MSLQIKKKNLGSNQVDGSKVLLAQGQAIRALDSNGVEKDLIEFGAASEVLVNGSEVAYKTEVEDLQSQITNVLSNVDPTALDSLSEIVTAFEAADESLNGAITALATSLGNEINAEESARIAGDSTLQANINAEALIRESGDAETLESSKDYTDAQISAIPAVDLSSYYNKTEVDSKDSALDERIDALEADKEIIEVESIGEAPELGLVGKVYVAKDSNKLYRWATVGGGELSFDLVVGAGEAHTTLQSALAAASNGQKILVKSGTYLVSSTIAVSKEVIIVGEDADAVIFETAATTSAPVSMFNVSANNVALAKMTIKHKKTSNTSVETAVVASGGGFPQTRITNFIMEQCKIEFVEFGLTVRAQDWCVRNSQFTYATGSVSNSCRAIGIYGTKGNAFIKDNFLKNDVLNGTAFRPFYLTSTTGSNPNETVEGKLVLEGTTHVGPLAQFWNQDNQQGSSGSFELQIKNNIINESNLFAAFYSATANAGDMFSSITLSGNTLSNLHAVDGGKGLYGVAGTAAFRSSPLIVHASNNTLGQEVYRAGWMAVQGSLIGKETAVPDFTVSLDSVIPASGDAPSVSPSPTTSYVEVSEQPDLSEIESSIENLQAADTTIRSEFAAADDNKLVEAKAYTDSQIAAIPSVDLSSYETIVNVDSKDAAKLVEAKAYTDAEIVASKAYADATFALQSDLVSIDEALAATQADLSQFSQDLANAINAEEARALAAEASLQSQITNVLSNVDGAALDSLTEIVTAFQAADSNLNGAITSLASSASSALSAEESARIAADQSLQSAIDSHLNDAVDAHDASAISFDNSGTDVVATNVQGAIVEVGTVLTQELEAEVSRAMGVESSLQSQIDSEETRAMGIEAQLQSDLDDLDGYAQDIRSDVDDLDGYAQDIRSDLDAEMARVATVESGFDSRLDALEAQTDGPSFHKMKIEVSTNLAYVELAHEAIANSIVVSVGRLMAHKDEDFTVSVVGGVTRLTWIGSMVSPDGVEAIESGDKVFVTYAH